MGSLKLIHSIAPHFYEQFTPAGTRVEVVPFEIVRTERSLDLSAGPLALHLRAAPGWNLPFPRLRPPWVCRCQ